MEKITVERSIWINAPRERVWEAITNADVIQQWWGDYWEIPALQVGATLKFGDADDPILATIATIDPPREFRIQWPPQEQYHHIEVFTTFLLQEELGGTRITVTESGFEALPDDIRQTRIDQTSAGYTTVLGDLKALLEGRSLPHV